jgi:hypothetical protein
MIAFALENANAGALCSARTRCKLKRVHDRLDGGKLHFILFILHLHMSTIDETLQWYLSGEYSFSFPSLKASTREMGPFFFLAGV